MIFPADEINLSTSRRHQAEQNPLEGYNRGLTEKSPVAKRHVMSSDLQFHYITASVGGWNILPRSTSIRHFSPPSLFPFPLFMHIYILSLSLTRIYLLTHPIIHSPFYPFFKTLCVNEHYLLLWLAPLLSIQVYILQRKISLALWGSLYFFVHFPPFCSVLIRAILYLLFVSLVDFFFFCHPSLPFLSIISIQNVDLSLSSHR